MKKKKNKSQQQTKTGPFDRKINQAFKAARKEMNATLKRAATLNI